MNNISCLYFHRLIFMFYLDTYYYCRIKRRKVEVYEEMVDSHSSKCQGEAPQTLGDTTISDASMIFSSVILYRNQVFYSCFS